MSTDLFDLIKTHGIVNQTCNAYMYDDYGEQAWVDIILFLSTQQYTPAMITVILMSKHMRWAYDMRSTATCEEFKRYFNRKADDGRTGEFYIDVFLEKEYGYLKLEDV